MARAQEGSCRYTNSRPLQGLGMLNLKIGLAAGADRNVGHF